MGVHPVTNLRWRLGGLFFPSTNINIRTGAGIGTIVTFNLMGYLSDVSQTI